MINEILEKKRGLGSLTGISSDWAREMCIDRTGEAIMSKGITRYASRTEIFRREHAPRGHYSHKRVERGFLWVLFPHQRAETKGAGEAKSMSVSEIA